jgi:hypothetical protein
MEDMAPLAEDNVFHAATVASILGELAGAGDT